MTVAAFSPEPQSLAADFPKADEAAWRGLVETSLKGKPWSGLESRTADGIVFGPLHTASPAPSAAALSLAPRDATRPWDVRTLVAHPDPIRANAQALDDLENGAASVLVRIDPEGRRGLACPSPDDLADAVARALDGVHTDLAPVALDAGAYAVNAAQALSGAAGRGPAAPLAFHMDPLGDYARRGLDPAELPQRLAQVALAAAALHDAHPQATLFLADGRAAHEAGGTEAQELGLAAACALAYARAAVDAGLDEAAALESVVLGLSADPRYFVTIAKLRAARLIWSRLAAACGSTAPARIEALGACRTLSTLDPWTNLLRLTAAGFGAAVGGADAVILPPFTAPLTENGRATDGDFARRQARNSQLVLMEEAHLGRVADPAAGAWFVEHLTDALARKGWAVMQAIERSGGAVAVLRDGSFAAEVSRARDTLSEGYTAGAHRLIGVTHFPDTAGRPVEIESLAGEPSLPPQGPLAPWRAARAFELAAQAGDGA